MNHLVLEHLSGLKGGCPLEEAYYLKLSLFQGVQYFFWGFYMLYWCLVLNIFWEISCHHSSDSFTLYFYSLCTFLSLIEIMYYCISVYGCISDTFFFILLDICDIFVHFFIISPLSFHAENNLDHLLWDIGSSD